MSTPAPPGSLLAGRYRPLRVVGRGGMGAVWAAHDELLGRDVALKEVAAPVGQPGESREDLRRRALREARAAARVAHPCAVTVYDVAEDDGRHWIVMELLQPRTLADELARRGPLPPAEAARIGLDLLDALSTAHAAGVVHRDVKPSNVLLGEGRAVLADFGIATVDGRAPAGEQGLVVGSPAYIAPERARGGAPTPAGDLWALGATLYAAVEGRPPFWRDAPLPTLDAVCREDPPLPEHAGALTTLICALLAREPAARPDAALTRRVLRAVLANPTVVLPPYEPGADAAATSVLAPDDAAPAGAPSDAAPSSVALDVTGRLPRPRARSVPVTLAAVTLLGLGGVLAQSAGLLGGGAPGAAVAAGTHGSPAALAPDPAPTAVAGTSSRPTGGASASSRERADTTVTTASRGAVRIATRLVAVEISEELAAPGAKAKAKAQKGQDGDGGNGNGNGEGEQAKGHGKHGGGTTKGRGGDGKGSSA